MLALHLSSATRAPPPRDGARLLDREGSPPSSTSALMAVSKHAPPPCFDTLLCSGGRLHDYQGDRSAKHLRDWALSLLPKHIKTVSQRRRADWRGEGAFCVTPIAFSPASRQPLCRAPPTTAQNVGSTAHSKLLQAKGSAFEAGPRPSLQ